MNERFETYEEIAKILSGQPEDQNREYKAADALKKPETILRAVVGMLNSSGGKIFIGIGEKVGRASSFEGVEDHERERTRLLDIFLDRIKPRADVSIRCIPIPGSKRGILIVEAPGPAKGPYAFTKGADYCVYRRHGDRLRPMGWDEVLKKATEAPQNESDILRAKQGILERIDQLEELHARESVWIFLARPATPLSLDDKDIQAAIADPEVSGNRRMGWTFEVHDLPRRIQGGFEIGRPPEGGKSPHRHLTVLRDGKIEFVTAMADFEWPPSEERKKEGWSLYPFCMVEYPVSLIRLIAYLYREQREAASPVLLQQVFTEISGSTLSPGRPGYPPVAGNRCEMEVLRSPASDPLQTTVEEVRQRPDRIAYRLIKDVYEAFRHGEENIPFFEPSSDRFVVS